MGNYIPGQDERGRRRNDLLRRMYLRRALWSLPPMFISGTLLVLTTSPPPHPSGHWVVFWALAIPLLLSGLLFSTSLKAWLRIKQLEHREMVLREQFTFLDLD